MFNLRRRLKNLEAQLTDGSGLRPGSPKWRDYWGQRLIRILTGEEPSESGCIPLEVWDAFSVEQSEPSRPTIGTNPLELAQLAIIERPEVATDNA